MSATPMDVRGRDARDSDVRKLDPHLEQRPLSEIMSKLSSDAADLVKSEVELAKAEVDQKLDRVKDDVVQAAVGGAVVFAGARTLIAATVLLLATMMAAWLSALAVGAVTTGVGALLMKRGQTDLKRMDTTPRTVAKNINRDYQAVRKEIS